MGFKENHTFRSYETLESNEEPKYYIHLLPHQYKTGKFYGEYWYEINNIDYKDGNKFYDYLNKWLFEGYRDEIAKVKTNGVFIRTCHGSAFRDAEESTGVFSDYISNIFETKTKYPLRPHFLRNIYITHINNLNLPEETRRAIAYMMHHDLDTANKTYNKQTMDEKIALGVEFVNQQNLKSITDTSELVAISP